MAGDSGTGHRSACPGMSDVAVLMPYRGGDPWRDAGYAWVRRWWALTYPAWPVIPGECPPGDWRKGTAVADAAARADAAVYVVADADVFCDGVGAAVAAVTAGAPWATPHRAVHRLTAWATRDLLSGGPTPTCGAGPVRRRIGHDLEEVHTAVAGGGITVLPAPLWDRVPIDHRFTGWGQEDMAWGHALSVLAGPAYRGMVPLWHLWHPPQPRRSRRVGSAAGQELWMRYYRAGSAAALTAVVADAAGGTGPVRAGLSGTPG